MKILFLILLGPVLSLTAFENPKPRNYYIDKESGHVIARMSFKYRNVTSLNKVPMAKITLKTELQQFEESLRKNSKPKRVLRERDHFYYKGKSLNDLKEKDFDNAYQNLVKEKLSALEKRYNATIDSMSEETSKDQNEDMS